MNGKLMHAVARSAIDGPVSNKYLDREDDQKTHVTSIDDRAFHRGGKQSSTGRTTGKNGGKSSGGGGGNNGQAPKKPSVRGFWVCCDCMNANNPAHVPTYCICPSHHRKCSRCYVYKD